MKKPIVKEVTKEALTCEIAYENISDFFSNEKPFVLFGTGTSCSLDLAFGMPALEKHLRDSLSTGLTTDQNTQWLKVTEALDSKTCDFESAMDYIQDEELTNKVVELTAGFVGQYDAEYSHKIIIGSIYWPPDNLFKKLVNTLPETDRQLHVATPNYDMLAEYSFIYHEITYLTGFYGNYCKFYDWDKSAKVTKEYGNGLAQGKQKQIKKESKHIRLHKPHGSLNTFHVGDRIVECDAWISQKPSEIIRSMITPGTSKYKKLHEDRTQLSDYDRAVQSHNRFLFLGFGFNDSQLVNNVFKQKLEHDKCFALIITRDTNEKIETWLKNCPNMWLVCKQIDNDGTRIFNSKYADWLLIDGKALWQIDTFTAEFLGD